MRRVMKFGRRVWAKLWSDSSKFQKSWFVFIFVLGFGIYNFATTPKSPSVPSRQEKQFCENGKGRFFAITLESFSLVDLDKGRQMDRESYNQSDEHKMFLENEKAGRKEFDPKRMIRGFDLMLRQIQDNNLIMGYVGFPIVLARPGSKFTKFAGTDINAISKAAIQSAVAGDTRGTEQLIDGIWAVGTGRNNFAVLELKGLPPLSEYPFGGPRPTKVSLNWCLYESGWLGF